MPTRVITICLFLLVFSAGLGFVAANNDVWQPQESKITASSVTTMLNNTLVSWNPNLYSGINPFFFGDIVRGTASLIMTVGTMITIIPAVMVLFPGFPLQLLLLIQAVIYFIYYEGWLKIITGRDI